MPQGLQANWVDESSIGTTEEGGGKDELMGGVRGFYRKKDAQSME